MFFLILIRSSLLKLSFSIQIVIRIRGYAGYHHYHEYSPQNCRDYAQNESYSSYPFIISFFFSHYRKNKSHDSANAYSTAYCSHDTEYQRSNCFAVCRRLLCRVLLILTSRAVLIICIIRMFIVLCLILTGILLPLTAALVLILYRAILLPCAVTIVLIILACSVRLLLFDCLPLISSCTVNTLLCIALSILLSRLRTPLLYIALGILLTRLRTPLLWIALGILLPRLRTSLLWIALGILLPRLRTSYLPLIADLVYLPACTCIRHLIHLLRCLSDSCSSVSSCDTRRCIVPCSLCRCRRFCCSFLRLYESLPGSFTFAVHLHCFRIQPLAFCRTLVRHHVIVHIINTIVHIITVIHIIIH